MKIFRWPIISLRGSFCPTVRRADATGTSVPSARNGPREIPMTRCRQHVRWLSSMNLPRKTNPVLIHLLDNAISPALMRLFANDPPRVPWYGFARIDRDLTDKDYCMALTRSGCGMLKLGLESGDQGVLDAMQKGIDLETASRVLEI